MGRVPLAIFLSLAFCGLFPVTAAEQIKSPNYPLEGAPLLSLPVDCSEAGRCSVQNYVDFAPGPKALDHTCGPLTYNGHSGVDIRLRSVEAMERGVAVLAAATGTVIASRNDIPDRLLNEVEARQALAAPVKPSNSVSLYHGNGWTTHYGHLRKGSVTVKTGQIVKRGQQLGLIGASGSTNFPHLHFTLLLRDQVIDPYSGRLPGSGCGAGVHHSFWNEEAAKLLAYRSSGVLNAGLAERIPSQRKIRRGLRNKTPLSTTADQIVFWTRIWGLRRNDRFHIRLFAANGALLAESTQRADDDNAVSIASLSISRRTDAWPQGTYRGEYLLERPNGAKDEKFEKILKFSREAEIR
ncbi:M23 family metallopeptidase [Pelagibius sp. Alg239-R121]|uniref:M23 family metallopeptidase n=1 Tax=Pelagibius sp. Alg239-R121 TaxID=2993448 RepID=UPI0024A6EAA5|nr:M23 family metallopeptidase [Pelagibius sp. Alg239-R121]